MKNKVGTAVSSIIIGALGVANLAFGQVAIPQQQGGALGQQAQQQGTVPDGWVITPRVAIRETYTDDVALDQTFAQSDFVTTSTIGVAATHSGPRFDLNLDYALNHLFYPSLNDDEFRHNLQMNSQAEVVNDLFFIETAAGVNQQFIDRRGAFTNVLVNQTANRATVSIINVNPYLLHRVGGNFAVLRTGYEYGYVNRSQNVTFGGVDLGGGNNQFHRANMVLSSGTRFTKFTWNWANQFQKQEQQNAPDVDVYTSIVSGEYQINRQFAATGSFGYLKRVGIAQARNFDDPIWRIGGRLTPGPRTVIEASYGRDFFSNTWDFIGTYQITPNLSFNASYNDRYQSFAENALQNFLDAGGDPNNIPQQFINGIFTRIKTYRTGLRGTRGRSTITITAVRRITESQNVLTNFQRDSLGIEWTRVLNPRLNFSIAGTLIEDDFEGAAQTDRFLSGRMALNYLVSQNLTATLEYIRTRREQAFFNFVPRNSNYVSVALGYTF